MKAYQSAIHTATGSILIAIRDGRALTDFLGLREGKSGEEQEEDELIKRHSTAFFEVLHVTMDSYPASERTTPRTKRRKLRAATRTTLCVLLFTTLPTSMAQKCISLSGSTQCSAFNRSSLSTDSTLVGLLCVFLSCMTHGICERLTFDSPFLAFVSSTRQFDSQLSQYVNSSYVQTRYDSIFFNMGKLCLTRPTATSNNLAAALSTCKIRPASMHATQQA